MIFDKAKKIWECVSKDELRPALLRVLWDGIKKHAIATNGFIVAVIHPDEYMLDTSEKIQIPPQIWAMMKGIKTKQDYHVEIQPDMIKFHDGEQWIEYPIESPEHEFPNCQLIIDNARLIKTSNNRLLVSINFDQLKQINSALNSPLGVLRMYFDLDKTENGQVVNGILIEPDDPESVDYAVLMPAISHED